MASIRVFKGTGAQNIGNEYLRKPTFKQWIKLEENANNSNVTLYVVPKDKVFCLIWATIDVINLAAAGSTGEMTIEGDRLLGRSFAASERTNISFCPSEAFHLQENQTIRVASYAVDCMVRGHIVGYLIDKVDEY